MNREIILVLSDIRSVHNVGAIFRTADAVGVKEIILTGITPTPFDRFGRGRKDFAKTALGSEQTVAWRSVDDVKELIADLKARAFQVIALEQDKRAVSYRGVVVGDKIALILGNEIGGIPQEVLQDCDVVIDIPMWGSKESLNVSVAAGIALYELAGV